MKAACHKLERRWRLSGLSVHNQAWKEHLHEYKAEIISVRSQYFSQIIVNNERNPRKLFYTINKLVNVYSTSTVSVSAHLCNRFLDYFSSKIDNARKCITAVSSFSFCYISHFSGTPLSKFSSLDLASLSKEVSLMKVATSIIDPIPTQLFKSCFASLGSVVLNIINDSLCCGMVPAAFKIAAVTPVPKKSPVDFDNLNSFCPISNLPFIAKILERIVASQLNTHLIDNNLFEPLQSGFRKLHSTETALVKVTNDLLIAADSGYLSILVLLDLSAAFDTVDHAVLLTRLETVFGVTDTVLNWFTSYLSDRRQFVSLGGCRSKVGSVKFGVPQGSILSPLLFSMYIFPLGQLLRSLGLKFHFYADDTQIYIHTKPGDTTAIGFLEHSIAEIKNGCLNLLCLNSDKTEVMLIGTPHQISKSGALALTVEGTVLDFQNKLKNLGVIFDINLTFDPHVQNTVKNSFFHLRNIARLRPMLSLPVAEKLINTFVFSRIDYCNALLAGVSKSTLSKLQSVQNSAARILTRTKTSEHISPVLESLHWLPVRFRIDFKIFMLTYKALHGLAPHYLSQLLSVYTPSRDLRSSDSGLLVIPPTRLRSMGDRAFSSCAPKLWNSLPSEIRQAESFSVFQSVLKTYFFRIAFK